MGSDWTHLLGLGLLSRGEKGVRDGALFPSFVSLLLLCDIGVFGRANLECSADTEDAVVGLLGRKTLQSSLNNVALLGDQVVGPTPGQFMVPLEANAKDDLSRAGSDAGMSKGSHRTS